MQLPRAWLRVQGRRGHVVKPFACLPIVAATHAHCTTAIDDKVVRVVARVLLLPWRLKDVYAVTAANQAQLLHMSSAACMVMGVSLQPLLRGTGLAIDHEEDGLVSAGRRMLFQLCRSLPAGRSPSGIEVHYHREALPSEVRELARRAILHPLKLELR
eukprot:CAMPEP_0180579684 /NCGR_PEP_ID=MMETSP1037_2-20121125/13123_1 /TAXON_ID=632150 /ORGANISM="Azadinium spinosum, Strain 3D9" /LENGTH=157 /DNA_ID=CAMNT_0022597563 /DNA_START=57 /DNA_END=526 /DNA_ORIENTATION=-